MTATIRAAASDDLAAVLMLWRAAAAEPTHTDDVESLHRLVARDAGALLVAVDGERIVGSIIAGWDGWRGSIYRLVVAPDARRHGLGTRLLRAAEVRLATLGAVRSHAIVVSTDTRAMAFWCACGWEEQADRARFVRG